MECRGCGRAARMRRVGPLYGRPDPRTPYPGHDGHYRAQRAEHVRHLERRDDRMAQFGRQVGIPFDLFQKDTPGQDFGRGHVRGGTRRQPSVHRGNIRLRCRGAGYEIQHPGRCPDRRFLGGAARRTAENLEPPRRRRILHSLAQRSDRPGRRTSNSTG